MGEKKLIWNKMSASARDLHTIPDHIEEYGSFVLHFRASGRTPFTLWPLGLTPSGLVQRRTCVDISMGPAYEA